MFASGQTVDAEVVRSEPYGVWFTSAGQSILVMIPDLAWKPVQRPSDVFRPGQIARIRLLRRNDQNQVWVGSVREADEAENPYQQLASQPATATHVGRVALVGLDEVVVELAGGAVGYLSRKEAPQNLASGSVLLVGITALDVANRRASLTYLGPSPPRSNQLSPMQVQPS